jgi:pimeloyl-ACP methyl ester carboxylesterase
MTMNSTLMPDLGVETISLDFNELTNGPSRIEPTGDGSLGWYVRRLDAALERETSWRQRPRLVVGHSFGGMLALSWLLDDPKRRLTSVDGLVLLGASAGPLFERVRLRLGSLAEHEWRLPLERLLMWWNRPSVTRLVKLMTSGLESRVGRIDFGALPRQTDFAVDLAGWRNTDWRAMRSFRLALTGFDIRNRLHEIDVPTIVLHGTRDSLFAVDVAEELACGLPNAELRLVEGAGHALPLTHGEHLVRAVHELCSGNRPLASPHHP